MYQEEKDMKNETDENVDADSRIESLSNKISIKLFLTALLILTTIVIPIAAWNGFLQVDQDAGDWFQRSGSLMVLIAIWAEFRLYTTEQLMNPVSEKGITWDDLKVAGELHNKFKKAPSYFKFFATAGAVLGTLIWGYGGIFR